MTSLAGQAEAVAPAVNAGSWTGKAHLPALIPIGLLWAAPATLVSVQEIAFHATFAKFWVTCRACFTSSFTVNAFSGFRIFHLPFFAFCGLADSTLKLVVSCALGADLGVGAQLTVYHAGLTGEPVLLRVEPSGAVQPAATSVEKALLPVFIDATFCALKQLVSVAFPTGRMATNTLMLQSKLSARAKESKCILHISKAKSKTYSLQTFHLSEPAPWNKLSARG